ncbi:potassium transporter 1 isoform X2 [Malania oleifera]|uniref:potassium transporter 1 isoform X2 n=1 Tax=Malania oleifera TaxID=397392 RepID=UPI0025AE85A0|nr:potassium transporter 1 isoform X2 [Malania oleifera]
MNPTLSLESLEQGAAQQNMKKVSCSAVLTLAYQSLGVVYGDLSTSPLYVYKATFAGKLSLHENDEEIYGVLSFIFWTITLIALFKYIFIVMSADDNGEGGTFALYSLLCRHARLSILPNQQATDEKLSAYVTEGSADTWQSSALKLFLEKHPKFRDMLLIFVLLGTCMAIGDGIFTPAISVLSAVSGVRLKVTKLHENYVIIISCIILVGLFSLQHHGTHRVAFMFAPIVTAWLLCISGIGIYNIIQWNPQIFQALSPVYMLKFIRSTGTEGWVSLGGVVLAITGVETMFADLGHFSPLSIKIAFTFLVYPSLILAYMGEAAFLSRHHDDIQRSFYKAIPGLAVTTVMLVTTCLMAMVIIIVWKKNIITTISFLLFFGTLELLYISASLSKVPEGGWISLVLSLTLMAIMYVWNYGALKKHQFDVDNKVSMDRILALGPSLGMVRVPGIGLIYTNVATGVPSVFGHFVTNLPAFHEVLVFVCVKSVQVPYVSEKERFLIGRVGPKEYGMFRCIIRYGYKNLQQENYNFENRLVSEILQFVEREEDALKTTTEPSRYSGNSDIESVDAPEYIQLNPSLEENLVQDVMKSGIDHLEVSLLKEESLQILKARESGVAYILGHSYAKAKKSSSLLKKFAINVVYAFLSKNFRGPDIVLNVPHTSLLEVGMIYHV